MTRPIGKKQLRVRSCAEVDAVDVPAGHAGCHELIAGHGPQINRARREVKIFFEKPAPFRGEMRELGPRRPQARSAHSGAVLRLYAIMLTEAGESGIGEQMRYIDTTDLHSLGRKLNQYYLN